MNNFYVGQKVVCVDVEPYDNSLNRSPDLIKGQIYTIREVGFLNPCYPDVLCVKLEEYKNLCDYGVGAYRFRPVTNIQQFRDLVANIPNKELIHERI